MRFRTRAPQPVVVELKTFRGKLRVRAPTPVPTPSAFRGKLRVRPPIPIGPPPKRRGRAPSHIPDPWADLEWENHPAAKQAVLDNPAGMTLEEIGKYMNITRERVRQIEHTAIRKLQENNGSDIAWLGNLTIAVPECRRCGDSFVRATGRQVLCDVCEAMRKRKRPHAATVAA